jgi:hypothetical protein
VKYYATQRGKIASLAQNDIEAYLNMATQFLNIGNPFEIKGLGTLSKINDGTLLMTPGFFVLTKDEEAIGKLKERQIDVDEKTGANFYGEKEQQSGPLIKILLGAMLVLIVAAGGWWLYSSFIKSKPASEETTAGNADTLLVPQANVAIDSPAVTSPNQVAPALDSSTVVSWKAYFRSTSGKDSAVALFASLKKKMNTPFFMDTQDSVTFSYYVQLQSAIKDTAFKRDSVRRFFQRPIKLEKMQ